MCRASRMNCLTLWQPKNSERIRGLDQLQMFSSARSRWRVKPNLYCCSSIAGRVCQSGQDRWRGSWPGEWRWADPDPHRRREADGAREHHQEWRTDDDWEWEQYPGEMSLCDNILTRASQESMVTLQTADKSHKSGSIMSMLHKIFPTSLSQSASRVNMHRIGSDLSFSSKKGRPRQVRWSEDIQNLFVWSVIYFLF